MNEKMTELANEATRLTKAEFDATHKDLTLGAYEVWWQIYSKHLIVLTAQACADLCRAAEVEARRAFRTGEVSELNTFNGAECADMIEEHYTCPEVPEDPIAIVVKPLQQLIEAGFPPEEVATIARKYIADLQPIAETNITAQSAINYLNAFILNLRFGPAK